MRHLPGQPLQLDVQSVAALGVRPPGDRAAERQPGQVIGHRAVEEFGRHGELVGHPLRGGHVDLGTGNGAGPCCPKGFHA